MTNEELMLDALGRIAGLLKDVKRNNNAAAAYSLAYDTVAKVGIRQYPNRKDLVLRDVEVYAIRAAVNGYLVKQTITADEREVLIRLLERSNMELSTVRIGQEAK